MNSTVVVLGALLLATSVAGCADESTDRVPSSESLQSHEAADHSSPRGSREYGVLVRVYTQVDSVISAEDEQGTFYRASSALSGIRPYAIAAIKADSTEDSSVEPSESGMVRLRSSELVEVTDHLRQSALLCYLPGAVQLYRVEMFQLPALHFRPLPSIYIACQEPAGSAHSLNPPYFCVFPRWSVIYSRQHNRGIPLWACALDSTGSVVAMACITDRGQDMFVTTEVHCAPAGQDALAGGNPLCARTANYDARTGLRVWQSVLAGSIQEEYFFVWPVGSM
jgi:hypothetical protein